MIELIGRQLLQLLEPGGADHDIVIVDGGSLPLGLYCWGGYLFGASMVMISGAKNEAITTY